MQDQIYQYDPNKTPFLTILSQSSGSRAAAAVFNHLEDEPLPSWTTLGSNLSSGSGTFVVATGAGVYFRAGDLVLIPKSLAGGKPEVVLVTSVATDTVTGVRDWVNNNSGTGGTAAVSGDNVLIMGNVNTEGAASRTLLQTTEAQITNYCQIIRTPWGITGTLDATATYGGPDRVYQAQKAATQHAFEQERTFLFGTKRTTTDSAGSPAFGTTGRAVRSTGGIYYWLTTNSVAAGGTLTHATMESLCEKVFRYGSPTKTMLCSRRVMSQLDNIAEARIETVPAADTYGVQMRRYVSGHGELMIKIHDLLINDYAGVGIVIDMAQVEKRFTQNSEGKRDALLRMNIQNNDEDAIKNEYLSEVGLHVHLEKAHGLLTGVT
jgi:hypothetical protein